MSQETIEVNLTSDDVLALLHGQPISVSYSGTGHIEMYPQFDFPFNPEKRND